VLEGSFERLLLLSFLFPVYHFCPMGKEEQLSSQLRQVSLHHQLPGVVCQTCWLPAKKNQLLNGSSVVKSCFIGGHNQGLPIGPRYYSIPGSLGRVNLFK
jgi:hypothetical protein